MDVRETHILYEHQAFPPFLFRLAREADDDIGGHIETGDGAARRSDQTAEVRRPAAPGHALQDRIGTALQGQVQVRHHARVCKQAEEFIAQVPRLHRAQTQPGDVRLRQHGGNEFMQAAAGVRAVAAHVHAGQHGLLYALRMQAVDLVNDIGHRAAVFLAARDSDDAEGAAVAAAVLHLDEGAVAAAGEEGGFGRLRRHGGHGHVFQFRMYQVHKLILAAVGHQQVYAGHVLDGLGLQAAVAAADDQFRPGIVAVGTAYQLA